MRKLITEFEIKRGKSLGERDKAILMELLERNICQGCRSKNGRFIICQSCIIELNRLREFTQFD